MRHTIIITIIPLFRPLSSGPHTQGDPCTLSFLRAHLFSALLNVQTMVVPYVSSFEESPRFTPSFQTSSFLLFMWIEPPLLSNMSCIYVAFLLPICSIFCVSISDSFGLELCGLCFALSVLYNSHSGFSFGQVFSSSGF